MKELAKNQKLRGRFFDFGKPPIKDTYTLPLPTGFRFEKERTIQCQ
jgi:hypothetical protein